MRHHFWFPTKIISMSSHNLGCFNAEGHSKVLEVSESKLKNTSLCKSLVKGLEFFCKFRDKSV